MNYVYVSRVLLIRFAKIAPFIFCAVVLLSFLETLVMLNTNSLALYDGFFTPATKLNWFIARYYEIGFYDVSLCAFLSFCFETCIWNRLSVAYLVLFLLQKELCGIYELYVYQINFICCLNCLACFSLVYKGIRIYSHNKI